MRRTSHCSFFAVATVLVIVLIVPLHAQFLQQGGKLSASDASGPANQGIVALSADGNTALIGGPTDAGGMGAAWVWVRTAGVWTQQAKLVGTGAEGAANQGISVALSADGNVALVGGFMDHAGAGAVWAWTRRGSVWNQDGAKLVGTNAVGAAYQGYSLALSGDGNTALIGGYNDAGGSGAAWVWTRDSGAWMQQGNKLVGSGAAGAAAQGYSVAISADATTALVGGFLDNSARGAVWVWRKSADGWMQEGSKLVGSGAVGSAYQGISAGLSSNGGTALIGGFNDNNGVGAAWVWTRSSSGVWKQQGKKLIASDAVGKAYQGVSVALSGSGNTALIGGYLDSDGAGATWAWTRSNSVWTQQGSKLVGSGAVGHGGQGRIVAIAGDGATAIAGAAFDNSRVGAAWVFVLPIDVSPQLSITQTEPTSGRDRGTDTWNAVVTIINDASSTRADRANSAAIIGPIEIVLTQLSTNASLANATGTTGGRPSIRVPIESLAPGQAIDVPLEFKNRTDGRISFTAAVFAPQR